MQAERRGDPERARDDGRGQTGQRRADDRPNHLRVAKDTLVPAERDIGDRQRHPRDRIEREDHHHHERREEEREYENDIGRGCALMDRASVARLGGGAGRRDLAGRRRAPSQRASHRTASESRPTMITRRTTSVSASAAPSGQSSVEENSWTIAPPAIRPIGPPNRVGVA